MTKTSIIIIHSLPDKKIKSLGNKALINIGTENVIDYQIGFCNKLAKNNEIIVIGAFESKKLQKYLNKKYPKVKPILRVGDSAGVVADLLRTSSSHSTR